MDDNDPRFAFMDREIKRLHAKYSDARIKSEIEAIESGMADLLARKGLVSNRIRSVEAKRLIKRHDKLKRDIDDWTESLNRIRNRLESMHDDGECTQEEMKVYDDRIALLIDGTHRMTANSIKDKAK